MHYGNMVRYSLNDFVNKNTTKIALMSKLRHMKFVELWKDQWVMRPMPGTWNFMFLATMLRPYNDEEYNMYCGKNQIEVVDGLRKTAKYWEDWSHNTMTDHSRM